MNLHLLALLVATLPASSPTSSDFHRASGLRLQTSNFQVGSSASLPALDFRLETLDFQLSAAATAAEETVVAVRVHGNVLTPDAEVLQLAGIEIGRPFGRDTLAAAEARLRASRRFERVEVLKRFASIADPAQILIVIVVDEGPVRLERTGDPGAPVRVVRSHFARWMVLPLVDVEDGYGVTYGAQFTLPDVAGSLGRLSVPLTWGGTRGAAVRLTKDFAHAPISRIEAGASIAERTNPYLRADDDRDRLWFRGERQLTHSFRAGVGVEWQHVSFLDRQEPFTQVGADLVWDTRVDPVFPRNAVFARAGWNRIALPDGGVNRTSLEGRGYIGLIGQTVLVVRAGHEGADQPLPAYLQPLLGGFASLRGFRAGYAIGDELTSGSVELRVPLTSPLNIGRLGVSVFADAGTVYDQGQSVARQAFDKGVGGSLWFSAAFIRFDLAVAHGLGAATRVHVGSSVAF